MHRNSPKLFVSWSGGKDCAQACFRSMKAGLQIDCLLNMVTPDGARSWSHGQSAAVIKLQAEAMGIPIIQVRSSLEDYDRLFRETIIDLSGKGITGGLFGTIDVPEHRDWSTKICEGTGIVPYLPLWGESQAGVLKKFVESGFKAVVVAIDVNRMDERWLGQEINGDFIDQVSRLNITPCGEDGEYHTFVYDGPIFKKRIEVLKSRKTRHNGRAFFELIDIQLMDKEVDSSCP